MFEGGELRLVLLKLIADEPRHGYDCIRAIEELTAGAYAPSPGVVYPTLTLLEDMGLIEEQKSDGAKKMFAVTADGRAHLAERAEEVDALFARLDAASAVHSRSERGAVRRAMHNLRHVIGVKVALDHDEGVIDEIVSILDETARRIERLK